MGEGGSWGQEKAGRGSVSQVIGLGQGEVACLKCLRKGADPAQLLCINHAYLSKNNGCHLITMSMILGPYGFCNSENTEGIFGIQS